MNDLPEPKDVLKGELLERGNWLVANLAGNLSWPLETIKVDYRGHTLFVLPIMKGFFPSVAIKLGPLDREAGERLIMRFLSAVSWVEQKGIYVDGFTGGNIPRPMGRRQERGFSIQRDLDLSYLPSPDDERALLALALMREARGLNHPAFAFLSFYRVLEVAVPQRRREWIAATINEIKRPHFAREVVEALRGANVDIAEHLTVSGRHAIAHAREEPLIDPDDPSDTRRLGSELPLIEALAELAIEKELGIKTLFTVYDEHLYELDGFRRVFGPDIIELIVNGRDPDVEPQIDFPALRVELRRQEPYEPLSNLKPTRIGRDGNMIECRVGSDNGLYDLRFRLDFANERLHFDIDSDLGAHDDGTSDSAKGLAEITRFMRDYWLNGQLRILNAETGELLSRRDAFIPVNRFANIDAFNGLIEKWKALAEERSAQPGPQET